MFKRKDGKKVKMDPFFRIIPLIMKERNDAQVFSGQEILLGPIDEYIKAKRKDGINIGYVHVIYSALVKTMREKPQLNQFVMNGKLYRRDDIIISMAIKKSMTVEAEESVVKLKFSGYESPVEIKEILNKAIENEIKGNEIGDPGKFVKVMEKTPTFILKLIIGLAKFMDKHNMLPGAILSASPFHSSAFVTNLGSIGLDSAYHHLYNFGTVGIFLAIGRRKRMLVQGKNDLEEVKTMDLKFVIDERISDGFYYATAMKQFFRYLKNPERLDLKEMRNDEEEL